MAELPPLVAPFRGERYTAKGGLDALIAPPYDVISKEDRARYAARRAPPPRRRRGVRAACCAQMRENRSTS